MRKFNFNFRRPRFKPCAGSSNFPLSVDNKTALTDGIDYVEADNINHAYVPINTTQTFIGAIGVAQSKATDLITQLVETKPTIKLSWVDADTVQASTGLVWGRNSGDTIRTPRKNTATTNITAADLDSGVAFANSEAYYVYAVADATANTVTFKVSTNATTPTGPTSFRLIGGFNTDGSGDIIEQSVWSIAGMRIVNMKWVYTAAVITTTTTIPLDDTIPQIGEGVQVVSLAYTPQKTTNRLVFEGIAYYDAPTTGSVEVLALFQDSTGDALAVGALNQVSATAFGIVEFFHEMAAGTVDRTTFQLRIGSNDTNTLTLNGEASARKYGGVMRSGMLITEYEV